MATTGDPWTSATPEAAGRKLFQVPLPVLEALADEDLEAARGHSAQALTPYLVDEECHHVWKIRRDQVKEDSRDAVWVTRFVVDLSGVIVGRAGFHGQPDEDGTVLVGYAIDPLHRRQGHARAAVAILLDVARRDPTVRVVRVTVRPDNIPSRSLLDQYGFRENGEEWDEGEGVMMTVLEVSVV